MPPLVTHQTLCEELARAKQGWCEVPLGSVRVHGVGFADVLVVRPSFEHFCVDIYEVKRDRDDFLRDLHGNKWQKYLPVCHRLSFAVYDGIAKIEEIPEGIGLLVYTDEKGWKTVRAPKGRQIKLDLDYILSLVFFRQRQARRDRIIQKEEFKGYFSRLKRAKVYGEKVALAVRLIESNVLLKMNQFDIDYATAFAQLSDEVSSMELIEKEEESSVLVSSSKVLEEIAAVSAPVLHDKIVEKVLNKPEELAVPYEVVIFLQQLKGWGIEVYNFDAVEAEAKEWNETQVLLWLKNNRSSYSKVLRKVFP